MLKKGTRINMAKLCSLENMIWFLFEDVIRTTTPLEGVTGAKKKVHGFNATHVRDIYIHISEVSRRSTLSEAT